MVGLSLVDNVTLSSQIFLIAGGIDLNGDGDTGDVSL